MSLTEESCVLGLETQSSCADRVYMPKDGLAAAKKGVCYGTVLLIVCYWNMLEFWKLKQLFRWS